MRSCVFTGVISGPFLKAILLAFAFRRMWQWEIYWNLEYIKNILYYVISPYVHMFSNVSEKELSYTTYNYVFYTFYQ